MTETTSRSPAEEDARRASRLAALERLNELHKKILAERGGVPIDVDSVLQELRDGIGEDRG